MIRIAWPEIDDREIEAVAAVLRSGYLVQGRAVRAFEELVEGYVGVRHAIAVSSGTAALHLAALALEIGPGDEVIVPDFTFPASANAVEVTGARAVLVDVNLDTFNLDPACLESAVSSRTRAVMPVHLFGLAAPMKEVEAFATQHGLAVIEDAACAFGAEYFGRKCGSMGIVGCFSFHPRKAITTGEGGMLVTNDDAIAHRLRQLRNHGMAATDLRVEFVLAGLNYRLTEFQGALGATQMSRVDSIIARRSEIAEEYQQRLQTVPGVACPSSPSNCRHVWQSYVILLDDGIDRAQVMRQMREAGVEVTIGTHAVGEQPHYASRGVRCANSSLAYARSLSLPMHTRLTSADLDVVVQALAGALAVSC